MLQYGLLWHWCSLRFTFTHDVLYASWGTVAMTVTCRVPGCGRVLKSVLGERRHFTAMHAPVLPAVNTICVESDDNQQGSTSRMREGNTTEGEERGRVGTAIRLESEVFLELARAVTAPCDSPRRARARRTAPTERARLARRGGRAYQPRGPRRGRRARRDTAAPSDAADDECSSTAAPAEEGAGSSASECASDGLPVPPRVADRALCDEVFKRYERFGDEARAVPAFPVAPGGGGGPEGSAPWTKDGLWHVFVDACTAGNGFGLSQKGLKRQYIYTKRVEAATGSSKRQFTDTFKTVNRFIAAVRRFKRALIAPLQWRRVSLEIDGQRYNVCYRNALEAAQEELLRAEPNQLCWGPPPADESMSSGTEGAAQPTLLTGVWDGEMFKEQAAHVRGTMRAGTRVLGLHLYSDSTVLSGSGAVSAYPLRMRVVNVNTDKEQWMTIAYIPQVEGKFFETRKGQEVRSELLQRVLHLAFRSAIQASHRGVWMDLPGGECVRVSPRALLYGCDQPEERAVMCLKAAGCLYPCTPCKVSRESSCAAEGASAPARDVQETVSAQLSNATRGIYWGSQA